LQFCLDDFVDEAMAGAVEAPRQLPTMSSSVFIRIALRVVRLLIAAAEIESKSLRWGQVRALCSID
jgi:hypothetical protein